VTVTVTNTLKPGGLTVTKAAPGGSDEVFSFTVTCSGDPNSPYNFDITGSESHTINGIPAGSSCTVVETSPGPDFNAPAYSLSATVVTEANVTKEVTVTNTLKTGDLTITKDAPASQQSTVFNFDITCTNPHTSPVGPYTASVTGSGSDTIHNIPAGSTCTVAEQNPGSTYNAPGYSPSDTVLVPGDATVTVLVTNSLKPGSLTITKVAPAGVTDTFTFNIDCGGENTYQLQITASGSATQDGIPAGSVCTITEVVPVGYAQPAFDPSNQVTVGAAQTVGVTVTNTLLPLGISIVKTANPISGGPGDPVTYTYVVKNIGQVDLINVSVNDDKLGHIGDIASLLVGESKTLTFNTTMPTTGGNLVNVGTAVGHDRFGRSTSAHDDATVTVVLAVMLPKTGTDMRLPMETGFALLGIGFAFIGFARKRRSAVAEAMESNEN
jgi:LPXTG-motif cell wall-anchored protein